MMVNQIGPIFFYKGNLAPGSPLLQTAYTYEQDDPYRVGQTLVLKYWPGRAFVVGVWIGQQKDETSALMAGIGGRDDTLLDEDGHIQDRYMRRDVAQVTGGDLDEEWRIVDALKLLHDKEQ